MALAAATVVAVMTLAAPAAAAPPDAPTAADHEQRTWKRCGSLPYPNFELKVRGKRVTCREARRVEKAFVGFIACQGRCYVGPSFLCEVKGPSVRYSVTCRKQGGTVTWKVDQTRPPPQSPV